MLQKKDKILFFNESGFKLAEAIFNHPTESFHLRKLCRMTGLSTTAITQAAERLCQFKIVTITKTELAMNIKANLESEAYSFYKQVFNLYRLRRYLFVDLLARAFQPEAIVLFGSFAKGEDVENSDIDVLVVTHRKKPDGLQDELSAYEKELNRHINLYILPSLMNADTSFKNAIANGIVLYGRIKVV